MDRPVRERRREPRRSAAEIDDVAARVRPGHDVSIVDVSPRGALVEGPRPLRPGTHVQLHLQRAGRGAAVNARVLRCLVTAIDADAGVTYRAALAFDEACGLLSEQTAPAGYLVPEEGRQK